jgi:ArsR family transcriptional regulator
VEIVSVYKCLCDVTRLRILNLLNRGPLCVCYLQEILEEPQVKISKHLSYLKQHGLIECERRANWSIYRLPKKTNRLLSENLKCLQDLAGDEKPFKVDLRRLDKLDASPACGVTK